MDIAHKALFNSLRMSWLLDTTLPVEEWKIEDLRSASTEALFSRLYNNTVYLDKTALLTSAEEYDSPEEFTEALLGGDGLDEDIFDQVYLIIFELWRRLLPEKMSISLFADQLDWQIFFYDNQMNDTTEAIEEELENLSNVLQENVDHGMNPTETFSVISEFFSNDLEGFLYDFIAEQIDRNALSYAEELLDRFHPFMLDPKWFDFLRARIIAVHDIGRANGIMRAVFESSKSEKALELNLDMLATMVHSGDHDLFLDVCTNTLTFIENEDDLLELFRIASDYFRCLDQEDIEIKINAIIDKRKAASQNQFANQSVDKALFLQIISSKKFEPEQKLTVELSPVDELNNL